MSAPPAMIEPEAFAPIIQSEQPIVGRVELERRLAVLHRGLRVNAIEAGQIISELRKSTKRGEWMTYSIDLYLRLKISRKTAERYVDAYEKSKDIGDTIIEAAELSGLNVNRIPVREALLAIKNENLTADASEIVKLTNLKLRENELHQPAPKPKSSSAADFISIITSLRSKLTETNQFSKQIQNGSFAPTEVRTLMAALRALAKDAQQRADRLNEILNQVEQKAA